MILNFINNIPKSTDEMNALKTLSAGRRIGLRQNTGNLHYNSNVWL